MPKTRLTELGVQKLKSTGTQVRYFDENKPGLVLVVGEQKAKTWRVVRYVKGKAISKKLGRYDHRRPNHLSVDDAWKAALKELAADPRKKGETATFKEIAERFIKRYVDHHKLR